MQTYDHDEGSIKDAENQNRFSLAKLGWCYLYGLGVEKNDYIAVEKFNSALQNGNKDA